jgi:hypothetical protein
MSKGRQCSCCYSEAGGRLGAEAVEAEASGGTKSRDTGKKNKVTQKAFSKVQFWKEREGKRERKKERERQR